MEGSRRTQKAQSEAGLLGAHPSLLRETLLMCFLKISSWVRTISQISYRFIYLFTFTVVSR